jgi:1,5-anhydro-D-fructose reductase (1,5-anhydro-D-mannitol-forming)
VIAWGVLGTGRVVDQWVAPAIAADASSRPLAVGSRDATRARELAAKHGFERSYGSYDDVLSDPEVDAVYIATPNALHAEQVLACAAHGKHVLCEKPLALSAADAERATRACSDAGVLLRVNFQYRHHPALRAMRGLIEKGAVGDVLVIQAEIGGAYPLRGWRTDPALAGMGATLNMGVHVYDLVEWLTQDTVVRVAAMLGPGSEELETVALTLFELQGGALAYVNANQVAEHSKPDLYVDGTAGRLSATRCLRLGAEGELRLAAGERDESWTFTSGEMFRDAVAEVAADIADSRLTPQRAGLRSAQLVEAIARAATNDGRVALEEAAA